MQSTKPPTRTKRPRRDYSRLERYRATILTPGTWDALLSDYSALGSHAVEGRW